MVVARKTEGKSRVARHTHSRESVKWTHADDEIDETVEAGLPSTDAQSLRGWKQPSLTEQLPSLAWEQPSFTELTSPIDWERPYLTEPWLSSEWEQPSLTERAPQRNFAFSSRTLETSPHDWDLNFPQEESTEAAQEAATNETVSSTAIESPHAGSQQYSQAIQESARSLWKRFLTADDATVKLKTKAKAGLLAFGALLAIILFIVEFQHDHTCRKAQITKPTNTKASAVPRRIHRSAHLADGARRRSVAPKSIELTTPHVIPNPNKVKIQPVDEPRDAQDISNTPVTFKSVRAQSSEKTGEQPEEKPPMALEPTEPSSGVSPQLDNQYVRQALANNAANFSRWLTKDLIDEVRKGAANRPPVAPLAANETREPTASNQINAKRPTESAHATPNREAEESLLLPSVEKPAEAPIKPRSGLRIPGPLPSSGSLIDSATLSPNARVLARQIGIADKLDRLHALAAQTAKTDYKHRMDALELRRSISESLSNAEVDVNFVMAEIMDEQSVYNELLGAFSIERDQKVAKTNLASFAINGSLWALAEAFTVPCARQPIFASPAGIVGIVAGIMPSVASAYALKQLKGCRHDMARAPNMLSEIFDRHAGAAVAYPPSVWGFLNSCPNGTTITRRDQLIAFWGNRVKGSNDIDLVTATKERKKAVTIDVLSTRVSMLGRLAAEVLKMNRLLNELEMALRACKA